MVEWIEPEPFRLDGPSFADELVGREALERLQSTPEVVGLDEVAQVLPELVVVFVVVAPDGGVLDGPVHSFDLAIGPRVPRLGKAMVDVVLRARVLEGVGPYRLAALEGALDERCRGSLVAGRREVNAMVGQNRVDLVGNSPDDRPQEVRGDLVVTFSCSST